MILKVSLLVLGLLNAYSSASDCVDGVNNVITVDSFGGEDLPVMVNNVTMHVYDYEMKPSCHKGKVNVVMPGYFVIKGGEVTTQSNLSVIENGSVSVTIIWDKRKLCVDGKSNLFIVPDSFCVFRLDEMVSVEVIKVLQTEGVHTIEELTTPWVGFNATMEIPESPSILFFNLIDVLRGQYKFKVSVTSGSEKIVEFALPTDMINLKLGLKPEDADEFSNKF